MSVWKEYGEEMKFEVQPVNSEDPILNIKRKLKGLGIEIQEILQPQIGPIVTGFPIRLSSSTPISKLLRASEDIALACKVEAVDIRRVKGEIIIYVPNKEKKIVDFMEALYWYIGNDEVQKMNLPLLLGQDVEGNNSIIELTKQPHILISGSTGSGKSIFEASLIASLAMLKSTSNLKMFLVDTKMLDLPLFSSLPHVEDVARTVSDFYSLITILNAEVETRNRNLANNRVRNIKEFNLANPHKSLPYIILIIDELADLIDKDKEQRLVNGKEHAEMKVMDSIRRLLQICRASGVHVIACTQRTSGDIVSALAKTNFPCRISLRLPSEKDSKYILDEAGAENLLGNGDMLLKESDSDSLKRYHAPFVRLEDIKAIISDMEMIKQSLNMEI